MSGEKSIDKVLLTLSRTPLVLEYIREHGAHRLRVSLSLSLFPSFLSARCTSVCIKRTARSVLAIDRWRVATSYRARFFLPFFFFFNLFSFLPPVYLFGLSIVSSGTASLCIPFPRPINSLSMIMFRLHRIAWRRCADENCLIQRHPVLRLLWYNKFNYEARNWISLLDDENEECMDVF